MAIHPSAIVFDGAQVHPDSEIGPFCVVGPGVRIGAYTRLLSHVVVDNATSLGAGNTIFPFASVGAIPQDKKFAGESARLIIGDNNVIREGVTINIGTDGGGMETRIGNGCLLMAYSHVAHDCIVGNNVILANTAALAGHVLIDDNVILGGMSGVHQFCRVGRNAFVAGGAMVAQDVPPFCLVQGDRARLMGLNTVGLKRAGWKRDDLRAMRSALRTLFDKSVTRQEAIERTAREHADGGTHVKELIAFVQQSTRGVCQIATEFGTHVEQDAA